jgi:hypothetical protein
LAKTSPARTDRVMNRPGGIVSNSRFDGVVATLQTSPQIYAFFGSFTSRRERRRIDLESLAGIESGRVGETSAADRSFSFVGFRAGAGACRNGARRCSTSRNLCRRPIKLLLHLPFIDTAGNAYLEGPGLLIYVIGQPRPAELRQDRFRALNPAGLHITFALLCRPELIRTNYREIAAAAKVALGTVGPVMKDLEARAFLRLKSATERYLLDPKRMLQEWVTHYPTTLRPKLNPRRFQADPDQIHRAKINQHNAYWGGEVAAERLTHFLKPAHFTIYAREPIAKLVAATRMRANHTGNVEILDAFWSFDTGPDDAGSVPPVLVYADLLATNDGRNAEAAKLIYEQRIEPTFHHAK